MDSVAWGGVWWWQSFLDRFCLALRMAPQPSNVCRLQFAKHVHGLMYHGERTTGESSIGQETGLLNLSLACISGCLNREAT